MSAALIYALVTVGALILGGLLSTVEAAVSSISRARVEGLVKDEVAGARTLLRVLDHRADHINLLVLSRILLEVTAAVFATRLAMELVPRWATVTAIVSVALILFAVVGVFSRTLGRRSPYAVSLKSAVALSIATRLFRPLLKVLIWIGNLIAPGPGFRDGPYSSEVELREMVDIAQEHGIVEIDEGRMIQNVFDLAGTPARQIMVPRTEMIWIEADKTIHQAVGLFVRSGHSRIPVVGENTDDIVGILYLKDLVEHTLKDADASQQIGEVVREATFVPDSKPCDELLHDMQKDHNHIVMLVDEYGGISGLVTLEDILEEIVGEIADEYDDSEVAPIEQEAERRYRVVARLPLVDLAERLEDDLDVDIEFNDEADTVGGLLALELGRVPLPGATARVNGLKLTAFGGADRRRRNRITSVVVEVEETTDNLTDNEGA